MSSSCCLRKLSTSTSGEASVERRYSSSSVSLKNVSNGVMNVSPRRMSVIESGMKYLCNLCNILIANVCVTASIRVTE